MTTIHAVSYIIMAKRNIPGSITKGKYYRIISASAFTNGQHFELECNDQGETEFYSGKFFDYTTLKELDRRDQMQ